MKKYLVFEKQTINNYKRDLIDFKTAHSALTGYLICLKDMGIMEEDRMQEEVQIVTKKLIEASLAK